MIINTSLTDGNTSIEATIEIVTDCLSISLPGNACVNICFNSRKITVHSYPPGSSDPETITLATV